VIPQRKSLGTWWTSLGRGFLWGVALSGVGIHCPAEAVVPDVQLEKAEREFFSLLSSGARQQDRVRAIRVLLGLIKKAKDQTTARQTELGRILPQVRTRQTELLARLDALQKKVARQLMELRRSSRGTARFRVLKELVSFTLKEMEGAKADLADSEVLVDKISQEKQALKDAITRYGEEEKVYRFHHGVHQRSLKTQVRQIKRAEGYQKWSQSREVVEDLVGQFNARKEFERVLLQERKISKQVLKGDIKKLKGRLKFPIRGKVVSKFGSYFDRDTQMKAFRRGIRVKPRKNEKARAIFSGRVEFSGVIPKYGKVVILNHGAQYFSLVGQLRELFKSKGDWVSTGDAIGMTDGKRTPVYFEIREKNVAVAPLQWISD